jgi:hypothetical protein
MKSGQAFFWVGAAVMAIGGGLLGGRACHDSSLAAQRESFAREREAEAERVRRVAAARRMRPLERIHIAIHKTGMFQGISVCPSEPLSNCQMVLGLGARTLKWTVPQIIAPSRCEDLPMYASVECTAAAFRADAFVPTDWSCRMRNGYLGFNVNSFTVVDLRERQLDRGQVELQCDEGRVSGTLDVSTDEDP